MLCTRGSPVLYGKTSYRSLKKFFRNLCLLCFCENPVIYGKIFCRSLMRFCLVAWQIKPKSALTRCGQMAHAVTGTLCRGLRRGIGVHQSSPLGVCKSSIRRAFSTHRAVYIQFGEISDQGGGPGQHRPGFGGVRTDG
jgi:hypothetical protein